MSVIVAKGVALQSWWCLTGISWNDGSHERTWGLDSAPDLPLLGQGGGQGSGSATSSTHPAPAKGEPTGSEPIFQEMQLGRKES